MTAGSISPKAAARLRQRMKNVRAAFRDEGGVHQTGEVPGSEINHPTNQKPKPASGFSNPTADNDLEGRTSGSHIDARPNRRVWPGGSGMSASNRLTGNTRAKGRIPARGGQYGGGGRNTQ